MSGISYEDFTALAKDYEYIPMWSDLTGDLDTPVSLVKKLGGCVYLLESVERGESLGRHSFIGIDTMLTFAVNGDLCRITGNGRTQSSEAGDPLQLLAATLSDLKVAPVAELQGFSGGAVGYLGYDMVRRLENLPHLAEDDLALPESKFVITKGVIAVDHISRQIRVIALVQRGQDLAQSYAQGQKYLDAIVRKLQGPLPAQPVPCSTAGMEVKSNLTRAKYITMVEKAKEYIKAGDIFQVVLSQRFTSPITEEPFEIYRRLRSINPSPYLYYLDFGPTKLIGSSPEMLVRAGAKRVETCPIAGTRPRGATEQQDQALAEELLANAKERAEHIMLVDLSRNDLGRVCRYGSVKAEQMLQVERFSHVMHLVSRVAGELRPEFSGFDALKVCFPAGTLSGAPKIRAMEIIEELEPTRRGPYGGAIGYLGFNGELDSCITIRTILIKDQTAYVQAGAGIVADSDPEREYEETVNKAGALLQAINPAQEGKLIVVND